MPEDITQDDSEPAPSDRQASGNVLSARYSVKRMREGGITEFVIRDAEANDGVVDRYRSLSEASTQCAWLALQHLRVLRDKAK